jgi:rRNA biogenesis protein RRP5
MQSRPLHKHVETMSRFAQLVFEYGKPERARTIFDGLLLNYPKRLDLFFVYIDKELKHGDVSHARRLLERQVSTSAEGKLKLSDKQMKSFFKKWFSVEEQHGNTETQEKVKSAARAYVQQTSAL